MLVLGRPNGSKTRFEFQDGTSSDLEVEVQSGQAVVLIMDGTRYLLRIGQDVRVSKLKIPVTFVRMDAVRTDSNNDPIPQLAFDISKNDPVTIVRDDARASFSKEAV